MEDRAQEGGGGLCQPSPPTPLTVHLFCLSPPPCPGHLPLPEGPHEEKNAALRRGQLGSVEAGLVFPCAFPEGTLEAACTLGPAPAAPELAASADCRGTLRLDAPTVYQSKPTPGPYLLPLPTRSGSQSSSRPQAVCMPSEAWRVCACMGVLAV